MRCGETTWTSISSWQDSVPDLAVAEAVKRAFTPDRPKQSRANSGIIRQVDQRLGLLAPNCNIREIFPRSGFEPRLEVLQKRMADVSPFFGGKSAIPPDLYSGELVPQKEDRGSMPPILQFTLLASGIPVKTIQGTPR